MKIAHVIATFPPHLGGMGEVAKNEAQKLAAAGHEVTVFTLRYPRVNYSADKNFNFKIIRVRPWFHIGDAGWAPLMFKLKNFDLVHLHYPFYGSAQCVYWARLLFGQKYVVTYHMDAHPSGRFKRLLQKIYDFLFAKLVLRGAEKVFTVDNDHSLHSRFGKFVSPDKVVDLLNAVDLDFFKPASASLDELNLSQLKGKKILLFVGNLLAVKKLDLLINAVQEISDPNVVLLVVGSGYEEHFYKLLAQTKGLNERVKFVGACPDKAKLVKYYNLATALVVPSSVESFSLVTVEALSVGKPVVISDLPGLRTRVIPGKTGFLFTPNSTAALKEALLKLLSLSSQQLKDMGDQARAQAEEKYNFKVHLQKLVEAYQQVK